MGAVLAVSSIATRPSMALLYSGLDPAVAGEVVSAIEKRNIPYKVSGNTIYVDASQRDLLRVQLAEEGLPATGAGGYELLDNLTGFGTTSQMFDATYWRAKEGELARTILAWPQVKSARVHIANQISRPFAKREKPTASVTLQMSSGGLSARRVRALRFLIASAVAGMSPENVSVIDSDRGLVSTNDPSARLSGSSGARAAELKQQVERLLVARVGTGNAVIEVAVDTTTDKETIVEHRFDPENRVAISTDTQEVSGSSADSGAGAVTVASNLPEGDAKGGSSTSKNQTSETREKINYEVSETTRELVRQPGNISRISVAVLVNGIVTPDKNGTPIWAPRSEKELSSLRALVETAVGYNKTRGDIVTIRSLEFLPVKAEGTLATASSFAFLEVNAMTLIQLGVLTILALGMGMFVLKPILTTRSVATLPQTETRLLVGNEAPIGMTTTTEQAILPQDPVAQLRALISNRQDETVEVLRNWIQSGEESV